MLLTFDSSPTLVFLAHLTSCKRFVCSALSLKHNVVDLKLPPKLHDTFLPRIPVKQVSKT